MPKKQLPVNDSSNNNKSTKEISVARVKKPSSSKTSGKDKSNGSALVVKAEKTTSIKKQVETKNIQKVSNISIDEVVLLNKRKKNKNFKNKINKNNKLIRNLFIIVVIVFIGFLLSYYICKKEKIEEYERKQQESINYLKLLKDNYSEYVIVIEDDFLYSKELKAIGYVSSGIYLELDTFESKNNDYFKLKDKDMYINYKNVKSAMSISKESKRYLNYIPFNKSIITNEKTKLYVDDNVYYMFNEKLILPIIINDSNRYYVKYNDNLVYVEKDSVEVKNENNSILEPASSLAILNYHFVINKEAGEDKLCEPSSICHADIQFDSHMNYFKENNFYTLTMKELELFIDGKINLPKKSVAITIDDGWFVERAIKILEKYNVNAALFLIGSLAPVSDYVSDNLEVHSHTWNLHEASGAFINASNQTILEDLAKSREALNNTTYFCYPFYQYNDRVISLLKQAGFTMALAGENKKVQVGGNKYAVPRFIINNNTSVQKMADIIN